MNSDETEKFFAGRGIVLLEKGRRGGLTYLCDLPEGLGKMEEVKVVGGRLVVKTESGVDILTPRKPVESPSKDS